MNTTTSNLPDQLTAPALPEDDPRSTLNIQRRQTLRIAERDPQGRLYPGSVLPNAGHPPGALITTLCRAHTATAIATLVSIMQDASAPAAARATSAQALLDRGFGKAPVSIDLTTKTNFCDFLRAVGIAVRSSEQDQLADDSDTIEGWTAL